MQKKIFLVVLYENSSYKLISWVLNKIIKYQLINFNNTYQENTNNHGQVLRSKDFNISQERSNNNSDDELEKNKQNTIVIQDQDDESLSTKYAKDNDNSDDDLESALISLLSKKKTKGHSNLESTLRSLLSNEKTNDLNEDNLDQSS